MQYVFSSSRFLQTTLGCRHGSERIYHLFKGRFKGRKPRPSGTDYQKDERVVVDLLGLDPNFAFRFTHGWRQRREGDTEQYFVVPVLLLVSGRVRKGVRFSVCRELALFGKYRLEEELRKDFCIRPVWDGRNHLDKGRFWIFDVSGFQP